MHVFLSAVARIFSTEVKETLAQIPRQPAPSPPATGTVDCYKLPSGVRVKAPAAKRLSCVLSVQSGLSRQFSVVYCFLVKEELFLMLIILGVYWYNLTFAKARAVKKAVREAATICPAPCDL